MGKRREARERAVQFLFQHELNPPEDIEAALNQFWESQRGAAIAEDKGAATWGQAIELPPPTADEAAIRLVADPLIRGTLEYRQKIFHAGQRQIRQRHSGQGEERTDAASEGGEVNEGQVSIVNCRGGRYAVSFADLHLHTV